MMKCEKTPFEIFIQKAENLENKNTFIKNVLNKIGHYLDKDFTTIYSFNYQSNTALFSKLIYDFIYICELNKKRIEKELAIKLIYNIIKNKDEININYENFINSIVQVIISDEYIKNEHIFINKLINTDLKLCLTEDQYNIIKKYKEKLEMNIISLFNILICFFKDSSEKDLLRYMMENLKEKYGIKLIVFVPIFDLIDIKKEDYIKYINQLLELNYESIVEVKILVFENYHFQLRIPTIDELITYINEDSQINDIKEVKKYSNNNTLKKVKNQFLSNGNYDRNDVKINKTTKVSFGYNFDINKLDPQWKHILKMMKEINDESNHIKEGMNNLKDGMNNLKDGINELKNENKKFDEEIKNIKTNQKKLEEKLDILKPGTLNLKPKERPFRTKLKKNNIRSLYKAILDIFINIFGLNLNDKYYIKIKNIIYELNNLPQTKKVNELKNLLFKVYSGIQEVNYLMHLDQDELSYSLNKMDEIIDNPIIKNLSLNEAIKSIYGDILSPFKISQIIENVKLSKEKLKELLH